MKHSLGVGTVLLLAGLVFLGLFPFRASAQASQQRPENYLLWTEKQARAVIRGMTAKGRVPGTRRFLNTDAALGYKLRVIWVTPEVIRASARLIQLDERLSDQQTQEVVAEAETAGRGFLVMLVQADPDEGPGFVPSDRGAHLQARGASPGAFVRGVENPRLEQVRVMNQVVPRDYSYERLWVLFPIKTDTGELVFSDADQEAELIVHVRRKKSTLRWRIPESVRLR